jgi:hypothetical protein
MSNELNIEELKSRFVGDVFDEQHYTVDASALADYARACGETHAKYTDPENPDFQAPPTFASSFHAGKRLPDDFPPLPGLGMDAGKAVHPIKPIRPGVQLTGKSHLHDIYTKTGRSGRMVFFVVRMEIFDDTDTQLASADTSVVIREKPAK